MGFRNRDCYERKFDEPFLYWEWRTRACSIERTEDDLDRFGELKNSPNRYIYIYVE